LTGLSSSLCRREGIATKSFKAALRAGYPNIVHSGMLARNGGRSYKTDLIEYCAASLRHPRTGHKTLRQIDFFNLRIIQH